MTLLLNKSMMQQVLTMKDALPVVESAFAELAKGTVKMPQREFLVLPKRNGDCFFMPAYLEEAGAFGIKVSPYFADNPKHDLPNIIDFIALLSDETGYPLAFMDAELVTAVRTGATSGIATDYLARKDAETVAMIGMGYQARTQLEAVCAVRKISHVWATSRDPKGRQDFVEGMSEKLAVEIEAVGTVEDAVKEADIVLLATSSSTPVVKGDWIAPGAHVSSILSLGPKTREVDTDLVVRSKIVCDSIEACLSEAGELAIPIQEGVLSPDSMHAGLGELVIGAKQGRENEEEVTFFKTVGLAIEDLAVARLVYTLSQQKGIGETFDFLQ